MLRGTGTTSCLSDEEFQRLFFPSESEASGYPDFEPQWEENCFSSDEEIPEVIPDAVEGNSVGSGARLQWKKRDRDEGEG